MTNKKLWLSLLAVVLIVCMLSVCLVSCKKDEEPETKKKTTPAKSTEVLAAEAIISGIKASVEEGIMTDLVVGGKLDLTINDNKYSLLLDLDLDLLQYTGWSGEGDNKQKTGVEDKDASNTYLYAQLQKNDSTILGVYYKDTEAELTTQDPYQGNYLYLQYKEKNATSLTNMRFPAPFINATMRRLDASVNFSGIDLQDETVWGTIEGAVSTIGAIAEGGVCTSTEASITLNLGKILDSSNDDSMADFVNNAIANYVKALDLDIDDLGAVLPNITATLHADLDNGVATGFDLTLGIEKKDIVITQNEEAHTLIDIEMDKDIEIGLGLEYTVGSYEQYVTVPTLNKTNFPTYQNIIDLDISVDLVLKNDLNVSFDLGNTKMTLTAEAGYYKLSLDGALDPFAILKYLAKDAEKKIDFSSTPKIINSIELILDAISGLELKLVREKALDESIVNETVLQLVVSDSYTQVGTEYQKDAGKKITLSTTILSGKDLTLTGAGISEAMTLVKGFISKDGKAPSTDTLETLATVGKYLLGAYIGINDGQTGHGKIFAKFDTDDTDGVNKMIGFSGYTEWKGGETTYKLYTRTTGESYKQATASSTFDANETYYTFTDAHYEKVDKTKGFDEFVYYYTRTGSAEPYTYTEANISAFADGTDYYVYKEASYNEAEGLDAETFNASKTSYYTYVAPTYEEATSPVFTAGHPTYYVRGYNDITYKYKEDGKTIDTDSDGNPIILSRGDFGIKLRAELCVDENISIKATIKNMDVFGLPNVLGVEIGNIQINLWDNDYPVHAGGSIVKYSTVK